MLKPHNFVALSPSRQQVADQAAMESIPLVFEPQSRFYTSPVVVLDFQVCLRKKRLHNGNSLLNNTTLKSCTMRWNFILVPHPAVLLRVVALKGCWCLGLDFFLNSHRAALVCASLWHGQF